MEGKSTVRGVLSSSGARGEKQTEKKLFTDATGRASTTNEG